jgi:hypothetical protein
LGGAREIARRFASRCGGIDGSELARPKRTARYGEAEQRSMPPDFAANYQANF